MGKILGTYLCPHPPIIIPQVGRGNENDVADTIRAMKLVAADIRDKSPETIIIITPHGPAFYDAVAVSDLPILKGDLSSFSTTGFYTV